MTPALQIYFQAEKKAGMFFVAIGILACWVGASLFMKAAAPFYIGFALPILAIGILQLVVGTTITRRTDQQLDDLERLLVTEPAEFRQTEEPRMAKVMRNFITLRRVELVLVVVGVFLYFWQQEWLFSKGLGLGLALQAGIALVADYFAEKRAHPYHSFISTLPSAP